MLLQIQFSNAQTITASGAATASTNVWDTEAAASNIGPGTPIYVVCRVHTAFTTASTGDTLIADLEHCATSGGTYVDLLKSPTFTVGQLVAGFDILTTTIPSGTNLRYLRFNYNYASGSGFTAGAISAFPTLAAPPPDYS